MKRFYLIGFLVRARRPELVPLVHALTFDPVLRATEVLSPLGSTMQEQSLREESWQWTKAHYDELLTVVPKHHAQTSLIYAGGVFCDDAHVQDVEAFFTRARVAQIEGGPRVLASTLESMRLCVVRRAKQEASARELFAANRR